MTYVQYVIVDADEVFDANDKAAVQKKIDTKSTITIATVRPETISLQLADGAATQGVSLNRINGELASIAHLGDSVQLIIRVPGRSEIISKYSRSDAPNIRVGSTVSCSWSELDVHVYPTSTNER